MSMGALLCLAMVVFAFVASWGAYEAWVEPWVQDDAIEGFFQKVVAVILFVLMWFVVGMVCLVVAMNAP